MSTAEIVGRVALAVYAVLLGMGGAIGYLKAGSRPSLIAGSLSAVVSLIALGLSYRGPEGFWLGLALGVAMLVVFGMRFAKTRKFMPSGLLIVASLAVCGLMPWAIFGPR